MTCPFTVAEIDAVLKFLSGTPDTSYQGRNALRSIYKKVGIDGKNKGKQARLLALAAYDLPKRKMDKPELQDALFLGLLRLAEKDDRS
jgi:hypothetical protein